MELMHLPYYSPAHCIWPSRHTEPLSGIWKIPHTRLSLLLSFGSMSYNPVLRSSFIDDLIELEASGMRCQRAWYPQ